jgi:two-component system sensor histidine kinase/response regulator
MDPIARVLIVDDEVEQATALSATLAEQGYETRAVSSAAEGLTALRSALSESDRAFDALITDLSLPGMDGIELLRAALRLDGLLAVVVMTGFGSIDKAVDAMRSGAADFIEKPFRLTAIKSVLTRALAVRNLRRENANLLTRLADRTRELEAANAELRDVNQELDSFAHTVSHDLRNPLLAMIGFADLLSKEDTSALNREQRRFIGEIRAAGVRLLHLTRQLLEVAKPGRGTRR